MSKKRRKRKLLPFLNFDNFVQKINESKDNIDTSEFYKNLLSKLQLGYEYLKIESISSIICYGLGNFNNSIISRYQLALLLLFKDYFKIPVYLYDPAFSETEKKYLNELNLKLITENEEGAREINNPTLIFLPHCPTSIINNLLWYNWGIELSNCLVLGNSFRALANTPPTRIFKENFFYVHSILPFTEEISLENTFKYTDIFNDISLHVFSAKILSETPVTLWTMKKKPIYDSSDIECVTNKLLNI